ncbi:RNA polymerase sigma factor [Streptomyces rapamycinicus]|uniref:RNA polymerase sigma factor n=1 Tax=Streptomyces rapamycinicus TaxID=1226757 RepID=UPI0032D92683
MTEGHAALDTAAYSRIYEAEYSRLCGYARTLTGNPWVAGDLVAEAHYSVWRRIRAGHPVGADAVPAELTSAVRALSAGVGNGGPSQQASYLEPLVQVLDELPQRWVKALWLAEVDGLPPEEVARRTGVSPDGAAALVERVRESVRQEFLRAQPGYPASAACGGYWEGLPGHVRGADSPHQAEQIAVHIDGCRDCRGRMEQLVAADDRLPALTGPALLALYDRDMARFLAPLAAAGAVGAVGAAGVGALATGGGAHAAPSNGPLVSSRRSMHHLVRGQVRQAGPVAVAAAAAACCWSRGGGHDGAGADGRRFGGGTAAGGGLEAVHIGYIRLRRFFFPFCGHVGRLAALGGLAGGRSGGGVPEPAVHRERAHRALPDGCAVQRGIPLPQGADVRFLRITLVAAVFALVVLRVEWAVAPAHGRTDPEADGRRHVGSGGHPERAADAAAHGRADAAAHGQADRLRLRLRRLPGLRLAGGPALRLPLRPRRRSRRF